MCEKEKPSIGSIHAPSTLSDVSGAESKPTAPHRPMSRLSHATFAQMFGGDIETLVLEFLWYTDMASLALTSRDAVHSKERLKRLQESTRLILELRHEIHRAFFPKVNKYMCRHLDRK